MRFPALRRHWERLGRKDPYWAVLTDPEKRGGRWDVAEFFDSGAAEIQRVLDRAHRLEIVPERRRALDFGCGAGRLTQALASHFDRCDGVDISPSMLRLATHHNRHPDRCTYHLNSTPDLARFGDESFDFVYSTLVLQHMEPQYSKNYMRELVRVLAPTGLLVFQLPSQRSTQERPADAQQTAISGRLPADAFRARITTDEAPGAAAPGQQLALDIMVENQSPYMWPSLPDARGRHQITVANHWLYDDGEMVQRDDARCPLPFDVAPGSRAGVILVVTPPRTDGAYVLEIDLVQEEVAWFAERGSPTLRLPFIVGDGRARTPRAREAEAGAPRSFRSRHPRAFELMRVTGIRDAYWMWRRVMDRVYKARDWVIVSVRDRLSVGPLINWWRSKPFAARMEMHCVPRAEVVSIVENAGGHVVNVEEEWMPGFQSCRYWVRKHPQPTGRATR